MDYIQRISDFAKTSKIASILKRDDIAYGGLFSEEGEFTPSLEEDISVYESVIEAIEQDLANKVALRTARRKADRAAFDKRISTTATSDANNLYY